MKNLILYRLFCFTILLFGISYFVEAQKIENQNSLIWEISGNELENPSYLFGTIHIIPKKDYFFTDLMKEKFISCEALVMEVDLNMSFKEKIDIAKEIFLPSGKTLKDYMSEDDFNIFSAYILDTLELKKSKLEKRYIRIKPFFTYGLILKDKLGKVKVYENKLNKLASKNKMKTIGLETIDEQISIVNKISIEDQVEMFLGTRDYDIIDEYNRLLKAYKQQDISSLYELSKETDEFADFEQDFLITRNKNWVPEIEKFINHQSTFIAVGALHLGGPEGVINLLREKGYTVRALTNNN